MSAPSQDFTDAYFLRRHPGWTWRDLQETPADIVDLMLLMDRMEADVAKSRNTSKGLRRGA